MSYLPTKHYNPRGYEAVYDPKRGVCCVTIRGYKTPDGKIVERGGLMNPDDKPVAACEITTYTGNIAQEDWHIVHPHIRHTFHDALADRRDLLGNPDFRHKPSDDEQRRRFAAAYDAAQKIRNGSTILGVDKMLFVLNPSLFANVDCFTRDSSGAFWLMFCGEAQEKKTSSLHASLAAYVLEAGEYVPAGATVRLGLWALTQTGPRFTEVPNDRITARDAVIAHLLKTPF